MRNVCHTCGRFKKTCLNPPAPLVSNEDPVGLEKTASQHSSYINLTLWLLLDFKAHLLLLLFLHTLKQCIVITSYFQSLEGSILLIL
jgi:hypothetical protein